jgi:RHS repeat-associated protein
VELDKDGALITYEECHPYGTTAFQAGRSTAEASLKRYRYTGKERDEECGLYYHGARYYAAWLGRWVSCDPVELVDGTNKFWSFRCNPILFKDPTGQASTAGKVQSPSPNQKIQQVENDYNQRVASTMGQDLGARPGQGYARYYGVDAGGDIGEWILSLMGKDYPMSREIFEHYLTANGAPLSFTPPPAVQAAIAQRYPNPGHFPDISPFNWGNPDIQNGLGHFNLDVVDMGNGTNTYIITDRYYFPPQVQGQTVYHGFQVGKLSNTKAAYLNTVLSGLGTYPRYNSKITERFSLVKGKNGDYTLIIPQRFLVDEGVDFEDIGEFVLAPQSVGATLKGEENLRSNSIDTPRVSWQMKVLITMFQSQTEGVQL